MVSAKHLLFAALVAAAACAPSPSEAPLDVAQEQVAELWPADTRTILTGDAARTLARQCSRVSPGPVEDVWTPTDGEIEAIEDELILLVARELEGTGQTISPGGYYRQYTGLVIGGRRIIYVNGIDESVATREAPAPHRTRNWRSEPILICDGGTLTFGAEYDPATRQFSNFAFNGSA